MLSIVIPTLNEARILQQTIEHIRRAAGGEKIEIVVSDCGSRDATLAVAAQLDVRIIRGGNCRADALNRGAAAARGEQLLFLHADSLPPHGFAGLISAALSDPSVVGGAFDFQFGDHPLHRGLNALYLKMVVLCNRIRFRWTGNFYGDQGIFVRRSVFDQIGGFPLIPLMEDIRFSRGMKRLGRTRILRPPMFTSPRRFVMLGVARQFLHDLALLGCESCGVHPSRLWTHYNHWNHCRDEGKEDYEPRMNTDKHR